MRCRSEGRRLALIAQVGPGQGIADVFVGSRRVARLNLGTGAARRQVFIIPGGSGTIVVRNIRGRVLVDALAVLRD